MTQKKKIAIIGGAGFIGHNLALKLKAKGHQVDIIDSLNVNNFLHFASTNQTVENRKLYQSMLNLRMELLQRNDIPLFTQDAREYHQLSQILGKIKPQVIILLAAVSHANRSNKDPYSTFDHSLRTLENSLDYAKDGSVEHFIFYSSSMVYGNFESGVVTEESECKPLGIYGSLKYSGEFIVKAYNQVFNLPYTIIRPSALYGERCVSRRVGQVFIENAMQGLTIQFQGDGEDRLDFTYIDDLVNGTIAVIENKKSLNQTFNLTYGESRSILDMIQILKEYFPNISIKRTERDKLMPSRGTLSVEKAKNIFGYDPQFPLEKGYVKYIQWYQENWNKLQASL